MPFTSLCHISWIWGNVYTERVWYTHNLPSILARTWKICFEGWTSRLLLISFFPPFTHSFLYLTYLIYVSVSSKHHSVYVEPKPPCLEKLTCFFSTPHWLRLHTWGKHTFLTLWMLFYFVPFGPALWKKILLDIVNIIFIVSRIVMLQWKTICSTSILSKS